MASNNNKSSLLARPPSITTLRSSSNQSQRSQTAADTNVLGPLPAWDDDKDDTVSFGVPARPRALWNVSDSHVPKFPKYWPPPVLYTIVEGDAPAVIAIRISECLLRRSIVTQYDDEGVTAECCTVDGCAFGVYLWRHGNSNILVELVRTKGSTISFHQHASAIMEASQGLDSGRDVRHVRATNTLEYNRLQQHSAMVDTKKNVPVTMVALEHAFANLCKDRFDAQVLGMESLVALTDASCVGEEQAKHTAEIVLTGHPTNLLCQHIHQEWITHLLVTRQLPYEVTATETLDHHAKHLRSLALRAFCNAILLLPVPVCDDLVQALEGDLLGAGRPPCTGRYSTPHDAALAAKALQYLNPNLEALERATAIGVSTHEMLYKLSKQTYRLYTEADRSC